MQAKIVDAVTAVLVCGDEILLMRRQVHLAAFPGYQAFPGGKVDQGESEAPLPWPLLAGHSPRRLHALIRELREEVAFDLEAALDAGRVLGFAEMGDVLTPPLSPVRFDTFFYRVDLAHKPEFTAEPNEVASLEWATPKEWVARFDAGELLAAPPTQRVLRALAADLGAQRFPQLPSTDDPSKIIAFSSVHGVRQIFVRSNTLPPADRTNCFLIGDAGAPRLLVDPSPANTEEFERLSAMVEAEGFDEVFLTHHHPDHRQFANALARRCGKPLSLSADTEARIRRLEPNWFDGLSLRTRRDGEEATRWLGHVVRIHAVPGHDEGQLALMPDNHAWCIVGDLIQGVGTVVIAAPEGDMAKYFATLEKVIAAQPRVIFPSHGVALGGTFYLEQTLRHRRAREAQVKALTAAGKTIEEVLAELYVGTDPRLMPLARMNIQSHLAKLRAEASVTA